MWRNTSSQCWWEGKLKLAKAICKPVSISCETRPTELHYIVNMNTITQLFPSYVDTQYKGK